MRLALADGSQVLNWTLCAASVIFTVVRLNIRYRLLKTLRTEDYLSFLATFFMVGMAICNQLSSNGIYLVGEMTAQLKSGMTTATLDPPYALVMDAQSYHAKVATL